ncbi:MAG: glycosyltransferase family 2 protein, partial [Hyphomicrobiaceae bacterium]|nr:glycosyltransferase family 2 protein [Hyphomicrobiaceae bacterium]
MRQGKHICVVIPALNEAAAIAHVIADIPDWVDRIVVADNGSSDGTCQIAQAQGALVVHESERGYGAACLAGIAACSDADIIVFLDGDYSDHPQERGLLVDPILEGKSEFVVG